LGVSLILQVCARELGAADWNSTVLSVFFGGLWILNRPDIQDSQLGCGDVASCLE